VTAKAFHADLTHSIRLSAAPETLFPLFEPEGERRWVRGWEPRFLWPASSEGTVGAVFVTRRDGDETTWVLTERDVPRFIAYANVTPNIRAARITVRFEPRPDSSTNVTVTYSVTGLSPGGNEAVRRFAAGYADYIESWRAAIEAIVGPASGASGP